MTIWLAMLLGLVQGVAEFLPISSSGHLAIMQNVFGMQDVEHNHVFFDVLLHLGTLVSVIIVYRKEVLEMIRAFIGLFRKNKPAPAAGGGRQAANPAGRLIVMIIVATLPLVVVLPLNKYIEQLFNKLLFVGLALIVTGVLLFISDRIQRGGKTERTATMKDALVVGLGQVVATLPGVSRSGTTITIGLFQGFERSFAVRFSFLMSIPAVLGANIISLIGAVKDGFDTSLLPMYLAGMAVAMVAGCLSIGLLKRIVAKDKFGKFAYYCWGIGAVALVASIFI